MNKGRRARKYVSIRKKCVCVLCIFVRLLFLLGHLNDIYMYNLSATDTRVSSCWSIRVLNKITVTSAHIKFLTNGQKYTLTKCANNLTR